jgi:dTMP kinase
MSFFITLEGIEGCGKTTQMLRLQQHLDALGFPVVTTREPGGCSISDSIRALLLDPVNNTMTPQTELLLYGAARAQHIAEFIKPALSEGKTVLCDRFTDATIVYQGTGRGLDIRQLEFINHFSTNDLIPDITLLLDLPAENGLQRAKARNLSDDLDAEGRFEMEALSFHERIRQGYLDLAEREERIHIINALGSEEQVAERIDAVVDHFLDGRRSA